MTKLEEALEFTKTLPEAEQNLFAEWLMSLGVQDDVYELSVAEIAELDRRDRESKRTHTLEEVFGST